MVVDPTRRVGDRRREHVPAALGGVLGVEVVLAVLAGTTPPLDDVLVLVTDDDDEVAIALHPPLGDRVDRAHPPVVVDVDEPLGYRAGDRAGLL